MIHVLPEFDLQQCNTLAVSSVAAFYVAVHSDEQLFEALRWAKEQGKAVIPLGEGSNVVLPAYVDALVVAIRTKGIEVVKEDDEFTYLRAQAGESWHDFVRHCVDYHYWGLENLALIPGCVGAAPIQNIGAYGVELKDVFYELQAIDIASQLPVTFDRSGCQFGYRDSIFKRAFKDKYIITSVVFKLAKAFSPNLSYAGLTHAMSEGDAVSAEKIFETVCAIRRDKLPDPQQVPNAGSFFKNPVISVEAFETLKQSHPEVVHYPQADGVKLAAGWLIDQAGWKGFLSDGAGVSEKQALVLINPGRTSAETILALAEKVSLSVKETFGVTLEIEPRVY